MAFTGTISHEGRVAPSKDILEAAVHCADQLRAQKNALDAPRLMKAYEIGGGYQVYVLDMENVWRVHIIPPVDIPEDDWPVPEPVIELRHETPVTIAGIASGGASVVTLDYHQADPENGRPWPGWYVKNDAVNLMPETAKLFTRAEAAYKVGVPENSDFAPVGRALSEHTYSQFASTEPGNYTGAMASIVQLLLGVGKLITPDYEERWLLADEENLPVLLDLERPEDGSEPEIPPSFYNDKEVEQIQITYDYRWNRTHGVMWGFDQNGSRAAMLVELGQRGIHVMPFPVDEHSQRPEVQAHYFDVYPDLEKYTPFRDESENLFEAFGGFPTGERMAGVEEELDRQVRSGFVLRADRDLSEFYAGFGMSTGFGWAFHDSKPAAINTGVRYNELGQKVGYCYEVRLIIEEKPDEVKVRNTVTGQVIAALELTEELDLFKAERLPQDFAEQLIDAPNYDQFDAFEVDPDWNVRAEIAKVREGVIDFPAYQCPRFEPCDVISSPHFKYYEPLLGVVLNFFFEKGEDVPDPQRSDGPIFATYVNGSAEILNYFYDYSSPSSTTETWNTRQPCQYVGSWEIGSVSEGSKTYGYFYTSSYDFREDVSFGSRSNTEYTGTIHGNYDFMSFCAFFAMDSVIVKRWVGSHTTASESHSGRVFDVSVICASNNRSMFFVCKEETKRDIVRGTSFSGLQHIGNSGAYRVGIVYNFVFHWTGVCRTPMAPPSGSPACVHVSSEPIIGDPDACHGIDPPIEPRYVVCCIRDGKINVCGGTAGQQAANEYICEHPLPDPSHTGCTFIQSAAITRAPVVPPAWSNSAPTTRHYKYEIRAFGHPLMHNRIIREFEMEDPDGWFYASDSTWWRCSLDDCRAPPWRVVANYYGPQYVGTNQEFWYGWVEYGIKPQVGGRYFGIVY